MVLSANDGQSEAVSSVSLHYALKYGVSVEVLNALIETKPALLLETDSLKCTPLHAVFLLDNEEYESLGIIRSLLTTPGENATKIKDSLDRLPLHIAASKGASNAVLELLIDAYADGCYRQNKDGDLPIHLLVRSGKASSAALELLIRPIMKNETICRIPGSVGLELPFHIAVEYNCSFKILETLLITFGKAASIPRRKPSKEGKHQSSVYALTMIEELKSTFGAQNASLGSEISPKEAAKIEMAKADIDLRSDLIFLHNPLVTPGDNSDKNELEYRKDPNRIRRLQNLIRREAIECVERSELNGDVHLSEMARLAWFFFCTFDNESDPYDHYASAVAKILRDMPTSVVTFLAKIQNPLSPHIPMVDSAIPSCKRIILNRILFVGR
jgi:ankyrin repeat protein